MVAAGFSCLSAALVTNCSTEKIIKRYIYSHASLSTSGIERLSQILTGALRNDRPSPSLCPNLLFISIPLHLLILPSSPLAVLLEI